MCQACYGGFGAYVVLCQLTRVLLRNSTMTSSTTGDANVKFPGSSAKLCGTSLVVAMHPSGVVMPRSQTCPVCTALSREGFGKSVVTVAQEAAESLPAVKEPWVCPRCSIIQVQFVQGGVGVLLTCTKPCCTCRIYLLSAALSFFWVTSHPWPLSNHSSPQRSPR